MKINFIEPPHIEKGKIAERVFGCSYKIYPFPNIFVLTAAALLEKRGYPVSYIDFVIRNGQKRFYDSLTQDKADLYCIYTVKLSQKSDLAALKMIRKMRDKVPVLFFGPAATDRPEEYLLDECTYVIRGEPEITILEFVEYIKREKGIDQIKGVSFTNDGDIIHNDSRELMKDLDILPFPARHLIDKRKYYNPKLGKRPFTAVLTSRGCSYRCIFCVPNSLSFARELDFKRYNNSKPPVRFRSTQNVIEEFRCLKEEGYKAVSILDDEFVWGEKRTLEICRGIGDLGIEWGCLARADHLNENMISRMGKAGCKYVDIGVESFNQDILDYIHKDLKIEAIYAAVGLLKKYGITSKINVIFGASPLETKDTINHTMQMVKRLDPDAVMFTICSPFPGTEYYKMAKENKWFVHGDYVPCDVAKESIISYPHLSKLDLEKAVRRANREFYLRPGFFFKNRMKVRSLSSLINSLISLKRKFRI